MARVLFVCLHNAGRSQMSEALFLREAGGRHEARSAGTGPDWDLRDPKDLSVDEVREIRDDIATRVNALVESLSPAENFKFTVGDDGPHR